jgi:hypothetical protein
LQRNLAQKRNDHEQKDLNLGLTTTMNEMLIGIVFLPAGERGGVAEDSIFVVSSRDTYAAM